MGNLSTPLFTEDLEFVIIDLFCGAGGASLGFHMAQRRGRSIAEVVACVNHDPVSIRTHSANFPNCEHFQEDMTKLDVRRLPRKLPGDKRIWILWMSPDCTHHSRAKGGAKDRASRNLSKQAYRYIHWIQPDYVMVENVPEFRSNGPLDRNNKAIKSLKGTFFIRWRQKIERMGYRYADRDINAADFGACQSRVRYFGIFAKGDLPIVYPNPTHDKKGRNGLPKHEPVRQVLDLWDEGSCIFLPTKNGKIRVDKTYKRVYKGLIKHVAKQQYSQFVLKYNNGKDGYVNPGTSIDDPAGTLSTACHQGLCSVTYLYDYRTKGNALKTVDEPSGTLTTKEHQGLLNTSYLMNYKNNCGLEDTAQPAPTLTTKCSMDLVQASMIMDNQYETMPRSTDGPCSTIMTSPKQNLLTMSMIGGKSAPFLSSDHFENTPTSIDEPCPTITAGGKYHYLINPQWGDGGTRDVQHPCFTIIARMDKAPPYIVSVSEGKVNIVIHPTDSEHVVKIKHFMMQYGLVDIKTRMLKIKELQQIQGFGKDYILHGTEEDKKRQIGNAVERRFPTAWVECLWDELTGNAQPQSMAAFTNDTDKVPNAAKKTSPSKFRRKVPEAQGSLFNL